MHLPQFTLPNIVSLATRRGVKTKAVVITTALVCTLFSGYTALAGQGVSQYCSDNVGNEQHIANSPVTLNTEAGGPVGPQGWSWIVCFSPTPWGDGTPAPTGGAAWFGSTQGTSGGNNWVGCGSDNNSSVAFGCNNQVNTNLSNPTSPGVNTSVSNGANVLGTPLNAPSAGAGTGCASGAVAVSVYSCATGQYLGISGTGDSSGLLAASGTGCAWGWYLGVSPAGCAYSTLAAASATGPATAYGNSSELGGTLNGFGVSGTNSGYGWFLGISGTGYASGVNAVSGTGNSYANTYHVYPGVYLGNSVSGTGSAEGVIAVGGNGCSVGWYLGVNAQGCANSTLLAVSGTGPATAYGNSTNLVLPNGYVVPNGFGVSGTNTAYGWLLGVSGTGSSSGVNAVSGTGNATGNGYEYYPGVSLGTAVSGANASGRDVAISGLGSAQNSDGSNKAALLTVSGGAGETWIADELIFFNSGVLDVPMSVQNVTDSTYVPDPVGVALKEQGIAEITPDVIYNLATSVTEEGPEGGEGPLSSMSSSSSSPTAYSSGTPKWKQVSQAMDDGQDYKNSCVLASTRTILMQLGASTPSEETLGREMGTQPNGTEVKRAARALEARSQYHYIYVRPSDATNYMSMVTYDVNREGHGSIQALDTAFLPWFKTRAPQNQSKPGVAKHANTTYGYSHYDKGYLYVNEIWNPRRLGWSQQQVDNTFTYGNPYGLHQVTLAEVWTAIENRKDAEGRIIGVVY